MCRPKFLQPTNGGGGAVVGPAAAGMSGGGGPGQPLNLQQIRQFSGNSRSPSCDQRFSTRGRLPSDSLYHAVAGHSDGERLARPPGKVEHGSLRHRSRSPSQPSRGVAVPRKASPSPTRIQPLVTAKAHTDVEVTGLQRGIASCAGTVFMSVFMTPLDVVKVRLQAQQQPSTVIRSFRPAFDSHPPSTLNLVPYRRYACIPATQSHSHIICQSPPSIHRFSGTMDAFVKIVRNEGLGRLWSGLTPALVMRIPSNVIYFSVYEKLKSMMGFQAGRTDKNSFLITLSASGTARAISVTTVSPIEMIRTKMQAEPMSYAQLSQCLRQAIKSDGLSSLWRGLGPMLSRDVMYAVLYWTNYELLKAEMCKVCHTDKPTVAMTFWAGAASGVLAAVVSTPFDVVKTQKQITIGKTPPKGAGCGLPPYGTTSWTIMRAIFAEAGIRGIFAGTVPRICKGAPSSAILITTYECFLTFFRKYNLETGYL